MQLALADLDATDRLTAADLPGLDPDEWVEMRRVRDFLRDTEAELQAWDAARDEAANAGAPPPQRISQGRILRAQFEQMVVAWNLYAPPAADGTRTPIPFDAAHRDLFFRRFGLYLTADLLKRGGALAGPPIQERGPDGEAPSFPEGAGVPAGG